MHGLFRKISITIAASALLTISATSSAQLKKGWDKSSVDKLAKSCTSQIMQGAKQGYYEKARKAGNSNPKPFPEKQLKESFAGMCKCMSNKAANTWEFNDFKANANTYFKQLIQPAMNGGECKPTGLVGKAIKKAKESKK
ncbi:MAG: hypothetical protein D6B27_12805 [Gammaproteobacteria bacterium]|nr:MAG: hypothetical protein D6B27_12805 [Gammaproteobacteria bacterium]